MVRFGHLWRIRTNCISFCPYRCKQRKGLANVSDNILSRKYSGSWLMIAHSVAIWAGNKHMEKTFTAPPPPYFSKGIMWSSFTSIFNLLMSVISLSASSVCPFDLSASLVGLSESLSPWSSFVPTSFRVGRFFRRYLNISSRRCIIGTWYEF